MSLFLSPPFLLLLLLLAPSISPSPTRTLHLDEILHVVRHGDECTDGMFCSFVTSFLAAVQRHQHPPIEDCAHKKLLITPPGNSGRHTILLLSFSLFSPSFFFPSLSLSLSSPLLVFLFRFSAYSVSLSRTYFPLILSLPLSLPLRVGLQPPLHSGGPPRGHLH